MARYIDLGTTLEIIKEAYEQSDTKEEALARARIIIEKVATSYNLENAEDYASTVIELAQKNSINNPAAITLSDINSASQTTYSTVTTENTDVIWSLDTSIQQLVAENPVPVVTSTLLQTKIPKQVQLSKKPKYHKKKSHQKHNPPQHAGKQLQQNAYY